MEQISTILQGGYAYLLIFQILVVSSLFVMLILMVLRRMRNESGDGLNPVDKPGVSLEEHEKLQVYLKSLEIEIKSLDKLKADNSALLEKVKFLESKLLEYEILQEEISSLSNLKVENEKLKKELLALQKDMNRTGAQIDQIVERAGEPTAFSEASVPANAGSTLTPIPDSTKVVEPTQLDGLLAEIDALSTTPKETPKTP